jgi:hypothetical protein
VSNSGLLYASSLCFSQKSCNKSRPLVLGSVETSRPITWQTRQALIYPTACYFHCALIVKLHTCMDSRRKLNQWNQIDSWRVVSFKMHQETALMCVALWTLTPWCRPGTTTSSYVNKRTAEAHCLCWKCVDCSVGQEVSFFPGIQFCHSVHIVVTYSESVQSS